MNEMSERRNYPRYKKQFKAHYSIGEYTRGGNECTIINASIKGLGVVFHTLVPIKVGSTIILEICVPGQVELYPVKGTIKWVRKRTDDSIGGIELAKRFDALPSEGDMVQGEDQIEETRTHIRFFTNLYGRYSIQERSEHWEKCTVFDVSRKGMGIKFHTAESIKVGATINLEIAVPSEVEPMVVGGTLRWLKPGDNEYIGGIELTEVLDEITSLIIMLQGSV